MSSAFVIKEFSNNFLKNLGLGDKLAQIKLTSVYSVSCLRLVQSREISGLGRLEPEVDNDDWTDVEF